MKRVRSPEVQNPVCSEAEREAIRNQMERMLANQLFKNSKRYPNLLRYIVEHTLAGYPGELKERTLGVEVFGRQPDYDTNADPIVRATAGEIRKRIAQYYHEHGHETEIRIDLSPGSYVPEFQILPEKSAPIPLAAPMAPARGKWRIVTLASVAALLVAASWFKPWVQHSALDRFWGPVLDSSSTVLLCVGQRQFLGTSPEPRQKPDPDLPHAYDAKGGPERPITLYELYYLGSQNVAFSDVKALGRLTGLLQAYGKSHRIFGETSTTFADLRSGPVVLIGAFNNDWTMRLTGPMRFSFERENDIFWIKDLHNPSRRERAVNYTMPYLKATEDYALISRVLEPTTDRMVVVAGGLTGYGTIAAGEFLTDPGYMETLAKQAPKDWSRKNIQVVIATKVINGNSGPPRVVDRYFW